jgi:hypothetical protein
MASVKGIKERLHSPIYDAFFVPFGKTFQDVMADPRHIRFFVDVNGKTRQETNMLASGTLPSQNRFEARAMRVVVSPPQGPLDPDAPPGVLRNFLTHLIFSSTTTLVVGEKVMIEMPTWFFPSGAGVSSGSGRVDTHGFPDPQATFRFAEPVHIDPQQNFRVEIGFHHEVPQAVAMAPGPLWIWVVLDGYMDRDVQ